MHGVKAVAALLLIGLLVATGTADYVILKVDKAKPTEDPADGKTGPGGRVGPGGIPGGGQAQGDTGKRSPAPDQPMGSFFYVVVEVKKLPEEKDKYRYYIMEGVNLVRASGELRVPSHQLVIEKFTAMSSPGQRFASLHKKMLKDGKTPERLLILIDWALRHGLVRERLPEKKTQKLDAFHATMEELREEIANLNKEKKTAPGLERAKTTLAALDKVKDAFFKHPPKDDDPRVTRKGPNGEPSLLDSYLNDASAKLKFRRVQRPHYTVVTNVSSNTAAQKGVDERLDILEKTYLSYFYWFALQGRPQEMPKHRLVAVLIGTTASRADRYEANVENFNAGPLAGDGFFARNDNMIVLASSPQDPDYTDFVTNNLAEWSSKEFKVKYEDMLDPAFWKGKEMKRTVHFQERKCFYVIAYQSRALAQKYLEEESLWEATTSQAARQLATATGLVPRGVTAPEWIQYGWGTFFQVPNQAMPGIARPNWVQLAHYRFLEENKVINEANCKDVLLNVVSDRYFRQALRSAEQVAYLHAELKKLKSSDSDRQAELTRRLKKVQAQNTKDLRVARSMSWALTYFLARKKLDVLLRYRDELNRLPRELEFGAEALEQCFTRAMQGGSAANLAREWYQYMGGADVVADLPNFNSLLLDDLRAEGRPPAPKKKDDTDKKY